MRANLTRITEHDFSFVVGGLLFRQSPKHAPRKVEIIMGKAISKFRNDANNSNEWYTLNIEEDKVYSYIDKLLKSIPEFEELNLSQIEYENGVKVHDENRGKYKFVTAYDKETKDSWKTDFVDLDAFIQNVCYELEQLKINNNDCFCCEHDGEGDICMSCIHSSVVSDKYEVHRYPKGEYTFACKYNCKQGYYICCEECKDVKKCTFKCDSNSKECGLKMNEIK